MLWGIIALVVALGLILWGPFREKRTVERKQPAAKKERAARDAKGGAGREAEAITAVVAIVIDDLGQDLAAAKEVMELPERVTLAVMPLLPQTGKIAALARKEGREVIVHIPMEAKNHEGKREAPGTLRANMTPMEFIAGVTTVLDAVPGAAGANNHEGSALTENREAMNFLMSELKARNLFFLDSYTDATSVALAAAKAFGVKNARRDVFLDNDSENPASIRKQLDELAREAKKNGRAIGIGHPHPSTLTELRAWLRHAGEEGIEIVPLSRLMQ
jgi:polysaccharide deacetylase 2 family uncharacterized protein YibQ